MLKKRLRYCVIVAQRLSLNFGEAVCKLGFSEKVVRLNTAEYEKNKERRLFSKKD